MAYEKKFQLSEVSGDLDDIMTQITAQLMEQSADHREMQAAFAFAAVDGIAIFGGEVEKLKRELHRLTAMMGDYFFKTYEVL